MSGNVTPYTGLITSEHADKPNFMATVAGLCQPLADLLQQMQAIPEAYDLFSASGSQLDVIGQWIGISRVLQEPLTGVYFAFDTTGVGFDSGYWIGPYQPTTGLVSLPDDAYLTLLLAKIAANYWDGTNSGAVVIYDQLFAGKYALAILDRQNMTYDVVVYGGILDPLTWSLLVNGYLDLRPMGVKIENYLTPSINGPIFAFDIETQYMSGFDVGGWTIVTPAVST